MVFYILDIKINTKIDVKTTIYYGTNLGTF